ncbi:tRNA (N6-threonylcarbamoyladenosine(37)-N6)-methyltransferase TrmO [bacterium]|nr:tRNA (N6-threonylcarbamoyladenosine(37)-N6)-methyltransferase TrmO [bacterium]
MKNSLKIIARIHSVFPTKFGIPRQSGLVKSLLSRIVFEPEFTNQEAIRGIENFSHLWLIWGFSANTGTAWSPTVRPPRLGGNKRLGVFATRSPFRPNPLGLSVVKIEKIEKNSIVVSGADLMDQTPLYDIKPYLPDIDSIPDATETYTANLVEKRPLAVQADETLLSKIEPELRGPLLEILALDPRPAYQHDAEKTYGFRFGRYEIKFKVENDRVLKVVEISD